MSIQRKLHSAGESTDTSSNDDGRDASFGRRVNCFLARSEGGVRTMRDHCCVSERFDLRGCVRRESKLVERRRNERKSGARCGALAGDSESPAAGNGAGCNLHRVFGVSVTVFQSLREIHRRRNGLPDLCPHAR